MNNPNVCGSGHVELEHRCCCCIYLRGRAIKSQRFIVCPAKCPIPPDPKRTELCTYLCKILISRTNTFEAKTSLIKSFSEQHNAENLPHASGKFWQCNLFTCFKILCGTENDLCCAKLWAENVTHKSLHQINYGEHHQKCISISSGIPNANQMAGCTHINLT